MGTGRPGGHRTGLNPAGASLHDVQASWGPEGVGETARRGAAQASSLTGASRGDAPDLVLG